VESLLIKRGRVFIADTTSFDIKNLPPKKREDND